MEYGGDISTMFGKLTDEILEQIWKLREEGSKRYEDIVKRVRDSAAPEELRKMEKADHVMVSDDTVEFRAKGEERARDLIRRHRLAERLFHDVLDLGISWDEGERRHRL
jgi:DtxR family Mn-dependent transcriptional regulator